MQKVWFEEFTSSEEGSALTSVLVISTIILVSIGAILSAMVLQSRFIQRDIEQTKAIYQAEKMLSEYIFSKSKGSLSEVNELIAKNTGVTERRHGLYSLVTASKSGTTIQTMIGAKADEEFNFSIFLTDTISALTLTGNPLIYGDMKLGYKGYRTENFKGVAFTGNIESNVVGTSDVFNAELIIPVLDSLTKLVNSEYSELEREEKIYVFKDSVDDSDLVNIDRSVHTIMVEGNATILEPLSLPAFTKLIVRDSLKIEADVNGDHLVFQAGAYINIKKTAELQGQIISNGPISISDEVYLHYPSVVLSYFNPTNFEEVAPILLTGKSTVDGMVFSIHQSMSSAENSDFKNIIDSGALVRGAYINTGISEVKGEIHGTVITHQFEFYESPTTYKNWIREGVFDLSKRPKDFIIPILSSNQQELGVLDWRITE